MGLPQGVDFKQIDVLPDGRIEVLVEQNGKYVIYREAAPESNQFHEVQPPEPLEFSGLDQIHMLSDGRIVYCGLIKKAFKRVYWVEKNPGSQDFIPFQTTFGPDILNDFTMTPLADGRLLFSEIKKIFFSDPKEKTRLIHWICTDLYILDPLQSSAVIKSGFKVS